VRTSVSELASNAEQFSSTALRAAAACARGTLQLVDGDVAEAARNLRLGWALWQDVGAPYEAAYARVRLAEALVAAGDLMSCGLELSAARSAFRALGAPRGVDQVEALAERFSLKL